jgi:hypothetical protein
MKEDHTLESAESFANELLKDIYNKRVMLSKYEITKQILR